MLFLTAVLALSSSVVTAPIASPGPPMQSLAVAAPTAAVSTPVVHVNQPVSAPKRSIVEFPWNRYSRVEQQDAEMRAELDHFFNVDRSR